MVSKKDLGGGYIIAVGLGIFGTLTSGFLVPAGPDGFSIGPNLTFSIFAGLIISTGFLVTGIKLVNSDLTDERIWDVAKWGSIGLGLPTFVVVFLVLFSYQALTGLGWQSVAVINIAAGGLIGILYGVICELRAEHERTKAFNQRNTVFLRLFRHDIRTHANIIRGHLDLLAATPDAPDQSVEVIDDQVEQILRLSNMARQLDDLETETRTSPVDLVEIVQDSVTRFQRQYPEATFEIDIQRVANVHAGDLLRVVVDNLLRNAIEHADDQPTVQITVQQVESTLQSFVELRIRDDGPGFPDEELEVHSRSTETALQHSQGIGLWLARWIVTSYDGDLALENAPGGGALVRVQLPAAQAELTSPTPAVNVPAESG